MVAFSNQVFENDYVYEIKYIRKDIISYQIKRYRKQMEKLKQTFSEKLNRIPYMVLVIVVLDDVYKSALCNVKEIEKCDIDLIEIIKESELPEK